MLVGIKLLKDLVTPENANVFVGKLGDILEKAIGKPLGYAINWGRIWYYPFKLVQGTN